MYLLFLDTVTRKNRYYSSINIAVVTAAMFMVVYLPHSFRNPVTIGHHPPHVHGV